MVGGGEGGEGGGGGAALGLNVRCQRLDQWLCSNAARGLRVACFFADFECSVYGRPKVGFSPLRDLQRFLRGGYAAAPCLLGLTLTFREPHDSRYAGPRLPLETIERGEYALEIPRSGVAIDGARHNCPLACVSEGWPCPAIFANHSCSPNARMEHWPATPERLDRLVLVASEPISAGQEVGVAC